MTYIIDFFNIFSDYREIYYKQKNIDFHSIKHVTLLKDTRDFFDIFFNHYIQASNISPKSEFIFVMKKIYDYDDILESIVKKYSFISIKFVLVTDKYKNAILDQNKDDFMCQYFLTVYPNSILISNDRYNNKIDYTFMFLKMNTINIQIIQQNVNAKTFYLITRKIIDNIHSMKFNRNSIPKSKLCQKVLFTNKVIV